MSYDPHIGPANAPNEPSSQKLQKPLLERFRELNPKQRVALREITPLAREGELFGCACAENGKPLPCEHCLDAIDEEDEADALEVMREAEKKGIHGVANLMLAAREMHWRDGYRESAPVVPILHSHLSDHWYEEKFKRFNANQTICIPEDSPATIPFPSY